MVSHNLVNTISEALSPVWYQAIAWIDAGLLGGQWGTHLHQNRITFIQKEFENVAAKNQPFCSGLHEMWNIYKFDKQKNGTTLMMKEVYWWVNARNICNGWMHAEFKVASIDYNLE